MNETTNEQEVLLLRRKLDLLLRTGKLLMESAADTNRIERNMKRVAAYLGIPEEKLHIDIRWTMLMVNVSDEKHSFSKFQKCEKHGINMEAISKISKLSWRAIEQDYSLDKYEEELEKIARQERNYTPYVVAICTGFACGGFCKLFGGDWIAFLITAICTFVGFRTRARCIEFGINVYMSIAISAFLCTCLAYAFSFSGLSSTPYHPLLACTLYIVPGVPLERFLPAVHFLRGYQSDRGGFVFFEGFVDGGLFRGGGPGSGVDAGNRGIGCGGSLRCGNGGGFSLFIVAHVNIQAQKGGADAYDDPCCAIHNVI